MGTKVKANLVHNWEDLKNPGDYLFVVDQADNVCGLIEACPCGCGATGAISIIGERYNREKNPDMPLWEWNGNRDAPSLTPSIQRTTGCRWHGYLTDGYFESC